MPISPQELIANLGELPPLPQVAAQVLKLAADPDSTTDDLQRVISTDQALAAQILKISNSASFGMMREVKTVSRAILTLGFSNIKSVVIASSAKKLYARGSVGLQEKLLWEHAFVTALASRILAGLLRVPRVEEAFLGGLMHDIGKSVMGLKFPDRYGQLVRVLYNGEQGDGIDLELETFGFDHTMVGEALLNAWNLAPSLAQAARWHHDPSSASPEHQSLVALVGLGNRIALELHAGFGPAECLDHPTQDALAILNLSPEALEAHRETILQAIENDRGVVKEF